MEIEIAVEMLVVLGLIGIFLLWALWHSLTKWIAKKRYKIENDKSRQGREAGARNSKQGSGEPPVAVESIPGPTPTEPRELLQATDADATGKNRTRLRGIFGRRRK